MVQRPRVAFQVCRRPPRGLRLELDVIFAPHRGAGTPERPPDPVVGGRQIVGWRSLDCPILPSAVTFSAPTVRSLRSRPWVGRKGSRPTVNKPAFLGCTRIEQDPAPAFSRRRVSASRRSCHPAGLLSVARLP